MNMTWNRTEQLQNLLLELVSWDSRTGTQGEIEFPYKLKDKLMEVQYFIENPHLIELVDAGKKRNSLMALYHSGVTDRTIVLLSHFDTVHVEEYGELADLAFQAESLTELLKDKVDMLPPDAKADLQSGEYLFGRGTMDMKMGLAAHIHLLEVASTENWPINLLLLTVPDEEVNSAGMRTALKGLKRFRDSYNLEFCLFLNSEPSFSQKPGDENYYIYSGSIGKIMPSALFYGRETHAGEPLKGISGHFMSSYLTQEIEFNNDFIEVDHGEKTPLPVCLQMKDLKQDYSTQTSHHSYALYNMFTMKRSPKKIMDLFKKAAEKAMDKCWQHYVEICEANQVEPIGQMKVLEYNELISYAKEKLGEDAISELINEVLQMQTLDEREMSVKIADSLMSECSELAPATILFFTPPYYPAVNSSDNKLVQDIIKFTKQKLLKKFDLKAHQIHYFNGISDLSYLNSSTSFEEWESYKNNNPVWGEVYSLPFAEMQEMQAPVINIGPLGRDAHKLTERLHVENAFIQLPTILKEIIIHFFCE